MNEKRARTHNVLIATAAVLLAGLAAIAPTTAAQSTCAGKTSVGHDTWRIGEGAPLPVPIKEAVWDCDGSGHTDYPDLNGAWYADEFGDCFADSNYGEWDDGKGSYSGTSQGASGSCKAEGSDDNVEGRYGNEDQICTQVAEILLTLVGEDIGEFVEWLKDNGIDC